MTHRLTWGRFIDWHGGLEKNIACDMAQEIRNRVSKEAVREMGPNKTVIIPCSHTNLNPSPNPNPNPNQHFICHVLTLMD